VNGLGIDPDAWVKHGHGSIMCALVVPKARPGRTAGRGRRSLPRPTHPSQRSAPMAKAEMQFNSRRPVAKVGSLPASLTAVFWGLVSAVAVTGLVRCGEIKGVASGPKAP